MFYTYPVGKIAKKQSEGVQCVFVNSALKIQCYIVNTLIQTAFSVILPTG